MADKEIDDIIRDIDIMKSIPPAGEPLVDCSCSSDDFDIFEVDDGMFNFYVSSITCNKCGKVVESNQLHPADVIWNNMHKKQEQP